MPMFDTLKSFRFWCHKIIPLVYDDSLSYYEFLCKVMQKLNEVIDLLNAHSAEIERFETDITAQFEALRTEVRNRIETFESLFVETYTDTKGYLEGDYVLKDDTLLRAKQAIPAEPFDSTKWESVIFATDFANWRRDLEERFFSLIANVDNTIANWISQMASPYDFTKEYIVGDIVYSTFTTDSPTLYLCVNDTTGAFKPADWEHIVLADWVSSEIRRMDEALDSFGTTVEGFGKYKADITNADIVDKKEVQFSQASDATIAPVEYEYDASEHVTVITISPVNMDYSAVQDFISKVDSVTMYVGNDPTDVVARVVPYWIGNVAYFTIPSISAVTSATIALNLTAPLGVSTTSFIYTRYKVGFSYGHVVPVTSELGAGFVDLNNIAMHTIAQLDLLEGRIEAVGEEAQEIPVLESTKVLKDFYPYTGTFPNSGTKVETFSSTSRVTIDGTSYFVHRLDDETTGLLFGQSGYATIRGYNTGFIIGVGLSPLDAYSNALTYRTVNNGGEYWYLPKQGISVLSTPGTGIFILVADDGVITGVNGMAFVSTGIGAHLAPDETMFVDFAYRSYCQWMDSRSTKLETQLGGKTIVSCTQTEYDAIVSPDVNTIYIITG